VNADPSAAVLVVASLLPGPTGGDTFAAVDPAESLTGGVDGIPIPKNFNCALLPVAGNVAVTAPEGVTLNDIAQGTCTVPQGFAVATLLAVADEALIISGNVGEVTAP